MGININDVYRWFTFLTNKWQGGTPGPEEFDQLCERASWELFATELGGDYEYQPGRAVPRVHFQQNKKVSEALRPFLTNENAYPLDSRGRWQIPSNYAYLDYFAYRLAQSENCETTVYPKIVTVISGDELYQTLGGYRAPSKEYPHASEFSDYWQFYPENLGYIQARYLKKPQSPHWAYTIVDDLPVYNATGSIDLEWNVDMFNKIVLKMCSYMGLNLLENELIQYAEQVKQA